MSQDKNNEKIAPVPPVNSSTPGNDKVTLRLLTSDEKPDEQLPAASTQERPPLRVVHISEQLVQPEGDLILLQELRDIVLACRSDLMAYREIVLNGRESVGIHQTRVALRRLRAAVALFQAPLEALIPAGLAPAARDVASACGPTRDWDVFLEDTLPRAAAALERHAGSSERKQLADRMAALARTTRRIRHASHDLARAALAGEPFAALEKQLSLLEAQQAPDGVDRAQAAQIVQHFARGSLEVRDRKVRKLGKRLEELSFEDKHRLRVRLKKLRYAATFLRHAFDADDSGAYIASAARLQEALGAINDRAVTHQLLERLRSAGRPAGKHDWLTGALEGWLVGDTDRREARLDKAWQRFRKAPRFWRSGDGTE